MNNVTEKVQAESDLRFILSWKKNTPESEWSVCNKLITCILKNKTDKKKEEM